MKLSDQQVQESIADFISEARACAERGNGFAAMSTIFNVILAVSEAVHGNDNNTNLLKKFVLKIPGDRRWLAVAIEPAGQPPSDDDIGQLLADIRNGFAHACSMPFGTILHNTIEEAETEAWLTSRASHAAPSQKWYFIGVIDFVDAVEATVKKLSTDHPDKEFDPDKRRQDRGPARGFPRRTRSNQRGPGPKGRTDDG